MNQKTIKLSDVKTIEQLNIISDRWYNRANYLKSIWQDKSQPEKVKKKAFVAWFPYLGILSRLLTVYIEHSEGQQNNFESGGISCSEAHKNESILNRN